MSTNESSRNTSENAAQYRSIHQSAAMQAALLVRLQYSSESKVQLRRKCIAHLKASLSHELELCA
ncbi:hypothetical protein [Pseudomonas lundensis]|uniref:hypothetical protein n=1 Tax=Pseudomonas lundensis TaxID=86185 RepID=UPI00115FC932|nr:hypothetical protein [Pseudomonas lundensis]NNA18209.1 hypothetical protein [Pseudomonas lundensis]